MAETLLQSVSDRGIATVTFNRPDQANSYDGVMLDALTAGFEEFGRDPLIRIIVLRGAGKHFSAGAAIGASAGQARRSIGEICEVIDCVGKPTVAVVQGACIGGALALASCCDVVLAARGASFSVPEVRLGFAPGPLIGYFARAMGYRALRRYLLSGERFTADEALRIGLAHEVCEANELDSALARLIDQFLHGAPGAIARAKQLLRDQAAPAPLTADEMRSLQAAFNLGSQSDEAREGRASFAEKRKPSWYRPPGE